MRTLHAHFFLKILQQNKQTRKTTWTVLLWVINILLVIILIERTFEIDNDKAPILFMFYYGVILFINLLLWISFSLADKSVKTDFKRISLTLLAVFIPLLTVVTAYG
jgi:hypothetical protein